MDPERGILQLAAARALAAVPVTVASESGLEGSGHGGGRPGGGAAAGGRRKGAVLDYVRLSSGACPRAPPTSKVRERDHDVC